MNPLQKIPAKYRWIAYVILGLAYLVFTAYKAADGDWDVALGLVLTSLGFGTAATNVDRKAGRHERA